MTGEICIGALDRCRAPRGAFLPAPPMLRHPRSQFPCSHVLDSLLAIPWCLPAPSGREAGPEQHRCCIAGPTARGALLAP